jgi:small subunit ribosomal protein S1
MKPKVIRRKKGVLPKTERPASEMIPEQRINKPTNPKPQRKEVKPKNQTPQVPRAKLDSKLLLSELDSLDRSAFDRLLGTPQSIVKGQKVEGTIIRTEKDLFIVDIGAKSEAFLWKEDADLSETKEKLKITAFVTSVSSNGIRLSQKTDESIFQKLTIAKDAQTPIEATVVSANNGGFVLSALNMRGFCPKSQIDIHNHPQEKYLNQTYNFLITDVNAKEFVASRKALLEEAQKESRHQILSSLKQGHSSEGIITSITDFGVFVSVFDVEGLLPKRKIPPEKEMSVGDRIAVKIDNINLERRTLSLALDHKDPWLELGSRYRMHEPYEGKIIQKIEHGLLVGLQFELVGLIHTSKLPQKSYKEGETITVYISSFDLSKRKLRLQVDPPIMITEEHRPTGQHLSDMFRDLFSDEN